MGSSNTRAYVKIPEPSLTRVHISLFSEVRLPSMPWWVAVVTVRQCLNIGQRFSRRHLESQESVSSAAVERTRQTLLTPPGTMSTNSTTAYSVTVGCRGALGHQCDCTAAGADTAARAGHSAMRDRARSGVVAGIPPAVQTEPAQD